VRAAEKRLGIEKGRLREKGSRREKTAQARASKKTGERCKGVLEIDDVTWGNEAFKFGTGARGGTKSDRARSKKKTGDDLQEKEAV